MKEKKEYIRRSIEDLQEFLREAGYSKQLIKSLDEIRADLIIEDQSDEDELITSPYIFYRKASYNVYQERTPDIVRLIPRVKEEQEFHLERTLTEKDLFFLSIGAIASSGIFIIPGLAAREAGVLSIGVWFFIGVMAILMSMCIAELASMYPEAGGIYTYTKKAFGKFVGFLVGWSMWVISWITIAMLISACISQYYSYLFPISPLNAKLLSIALLCLLTFFNYLGVRMGANIQKFFTFVTLVVLGGFIMTGIGKVNYDYFTGMFAHVNPMELIAAAALIIEPFIGWEAVTFLGEETKDPEKAVPKALVYSTIFIVILYLLVVFVSLGHVDAFTLGQSANPFSTAASHFLSPGAVTFLTLGTMIILLGSTNSWILSSSRLPYALAKDDLLPQFFAKIHNTFKTPVNSLFIQLIIASLLVLFANFELLLSALVPVALIIYASVFLAVPVLRLKEPTKERAFEVPFFSIISLLCVSITLILIFETDSFTMLKSAFLILFGIPFYVFIELEYDQRFVMLFNELIAPFYDRIAVLVYPKQMRKQFLKQAAIKSTDVVLNVSCHTGLILNELSHTSKMVVATDIGHQDIQIARKKFIERENIMYVICDASFLPFRNNIFHKVVSLGAEEENVSSDNFFNEVARVMRFGGRGTFIIFDLLSPPTQWTISYVEDLLTGLDLSFRVRKKQTTITNYYLFVTRKLKSQQISRVGSGDFDSYYGSHRERTIHHDDDID